MTTAVENTEVAVGDFFYASWGYDQTNVTWFRVVGMTPSGKSVRVQQWQGKRVRDDGSYTEVVPGDGPVRVSKRDASGRPTGEYDEAEVETKRLNFAGRDAKPAFRMASYAYAFRWDGRPRYQTGVGFGH